MAVIQSVITVVIFLGMLGILVVIHELGHFITARLANIRVHEFGIGFPPRAKVLSSQGETLYTLNWLPIGGFVRAGGRGRRLGRSAVVHAGPAADQAARAARRRRHEPAAGAGHLHRDCVVPGPGGGAAVPVRPGGSAGRLRAQGSADGRRRSSRSTASTSTSSGSMGRRRWSVSSARRPGRPSSSGSSDGQPAARCDDHPAAATPRSTTSTVPSGSSSWCRASAPSGSHARPERLPPSAPPVPPTPSS